VSNEQERLEHALGLAHRYLNARERTASEVRGHLDSKGIEPAVIDCVLALLTADRYVDDARFARLFVQDKRALDQWGAERIIRGLRTRGIDAEVIEAALAEDDMSDVPGSNGEPELERALAILVRRFPVPPRQRRERDRALGVLIRKGYDPELALDALAAYSARRA
jgi:regulatory protein